MRRAPLRMPFSRPAVFPRSRFPAQPNLRVTACLRVKAYLRAIAHLRLVTHLRLWRTARRTYITAGRGGSRPEAPRVRAGIPTRSGTAEPQGTRARNLKAPGHGISRHPGAESRRIQTGFQAAARRSTLRTARAMSRTSCSSSVGWTGSIRAVSPSSRATGRRSAGPRLRSRNSFSR